MISGSGPYRQQFYFWKNYRNNRVKHVLPRPLPETATTTPVSAPPPLPPGTAPPASVPSIAAGSALSPLTYGVPPGSGHAKNDSRNNTTDRRKRERWVIQESVQHLEYMEQKWSHFLEVELKCGALTSFFFKYTIDFANVGSEVSVILAIFIIPN
ncbi:hypothetical protein Leryth_024763 [Lithospermum erythrorhizon]|nr:hypothetical protein Leryth_024763 [Lithospermum erythrorhizon]